MDTGFEVRLGCVTLAERVGQIPPGRAGWARLSGCGAEPGGCQAHRGLGTGQLTNLRAAFFLPRGPEWEEKCPKQGGGEGGRREGRGKAEPGMLPGFPIPVPRGDRGDFLPPSRAAASTPDSSLAGGKRLLRTPWVFVEIPELKLVSSGVSRN